MTADATPPPNSGLLADRYLNGRFREQLNYFKTKSDWAKIWHEYTQIALIAITAAVPVTQLLPLDSLKLRIIAAVLGALAVMIQGIRSTFRFHENWLAYRGMEQFLEQERSLYETRASDYATLTNEEAFRRFVEAVENALKSEHGLFQAQNKQTVSRSGNKEH
jgi:hypothetical protein